MNDKKRYPVVSYSDDFPPPKETDPMSLMINPPRSKGWLSDRLVKKDMERETALNIASEKLLRSKKSAYEAARDALIARYRLQNVGQEIDDMERDGEIRRSEKDAEHEVKLSGLAVNLLENRNKLQELNKKRTQTKEEKQKERLEDMKRDADFEREKQAHKIDNALLSISQALDTERGLKLRYQDVEEDKISNLVGRFLYGEDE